MKNILLFLLNCWYLLIQEIKRRAQQLRLNSLSTKQSRRLNAIFRKEIEVELLGIKDCILIELKKKGQCGELEGKINHKINKAIKRQNVKSLLLLYENIRDNDLQYLKSIYEIKQQQQ